MPDTPSASVSAQNPPLPLPCSPAQLRHLLEGWLAEDLGRGDLTAAALFPQPVKAQWKAKAAGVFCGGVLVEPLLTLLDPEARVERLVEEGCRVRVGERLLILEGQARALAAAERTALNLAMRLSGVATATAALAERLHGTGVALLDTRKTTPGLRSLEKYAVRCGGGRNHRLGLDDAAMLKENHLAWSGGVAAALAAVRRQAPWTAKVIVEAETAEEALGAVAAGADGVLLDELRPEALAELVPRLRRAADGRSLLVEASGVDPAELEAYAVTGVDGISTSAAVTRSIWLDLSMRFDG